MDDVWSYISEEMDSIKAKFESNTMTATESAYQQGRWDAMYRIVTLSIRLQLKAKKMDRQ